MRTRTVTGRIRAARATAMEMRHSVDLTIGPFMIEFKPSRVQWRACVEVSFTVRDYSSVRFFGLALLRRAVRAWQRDTAPLQLDLWEPMDLATDNLQSLLGAEIERHDKPAQNARQLREPAAA